MVRRSPTRGQSIELSRGQIRRFADLLHPLVEEKTRSVLASELGVPEYAIQVLTAHGLKSQLSLPKPHLLLIGAKVGIDVSNWY